jgi:MFS family permease
MLTTSLAVIVGSASGGFAGAIVLYETALGVGIACGPLLGALLGSWSRRGPFFGVSVLMALALVATLVLVPRTLLAVIATFTDSPATLATCVAGAFIGINNTLTTQAVMLVAPVERPVASAAYGFLRFIGGGLAPWVAGVLAERFGVPLPFYLGALAVLLAAGVLATGHRLLARADEALAAGEADLDAAELEEVLEDGTGEAGARQRAEVPPVH